MALLIGCNYEGARDELRGCMNDVLAMKGYLIRYLGFSKKDINVLLDADESYIPPTKKNIQSQLESMVEQAQPGDVLFFSFSGHGERFKKKDGDTAYAHCIIAADSKPITDYYLRAIAAKIPKGCHMTVISDCCYSGGLVKGSKEQVGDSTTRRECEPSRFFAYEFENYPHWTPYCQRRFNVRDRFSARSNPTDITNWDDAGLIVLELGESSGTSGKRVKENAGSAGSSIILFSACQSHQEAKEADSVLNPGVFFGVLTAAILSIIEETKGQVTNRQLALRASSKIICPGFSQRPGLYCSDRHADAPFLAMRKA